MDMVRGITSSDSNAIQEAKKMLKSATKKGYHGLMDRYELDIQYRTRMLENGRAPADMLRMDLCANLVLAAPKQTFAQRQLGVGAASASEHLVARLAYLRTELHFLPEPLSSELDSKWIIMFQGTPYSPAVFANMVVDKDRPRQLLGWNGLVSVRNTTQEAIVKELEWLFGQSERSAVGSVEFSKEESAKRLTKNAAKAASAATGSYATRVGVHWRNDQWRSGQGSSTDTWQSWWSNWQGWSSNSTWWGR